MSGSRDDEDDDTEESPSGGINADLVASYVAFGKRALSKRRWLMAGVFVVVAGLVVGILSIWPRTYHCEARLMAQRSQVLSVHGDDAALSGASDLILRHENLEAIVKQTDLVRLARERRTGIFRLKDRIMERLRGKPSEKDEISGLVWTLETKLNVSTEQGALTIAADWTDPQVSSLLVDAALTNFLETRHVAEVSTIVEYIAILEGHATRLRNEVDSVAQETRQLRDDRRHEVEQKLAKGKAAAGASATATDPAPVRRAPARPRPDVDEEATRLKVLLDAKQRTIAELENHRSQRLLDLQNKLSELLSKYTSAHPLVLDARQNIATLSHESPQVTALRDEAKQLEASIRQRTGAGMVNTGAGLAGTFGPHSAGGGGTAATTAEPLPSEIMGLLQDSAEDDPAVSAQLRYAIDKYTSIRGQISSSRVDLDTAQAAFKYRYQLVVPPEPPEKPIKPKVPLVLGAGLFAAVILAMAAAIGAELKAGRIVERWQVDQLALPLLAELRFPPASSTTTTPKE